MNANEHNALANAGKKKKVARKIWLSVFLLLPSLIALVSFVIIYNNLYFSASNIYDITFYDAEGKVIGSEKNYLRDAEKDGLVALFSPVTESLSTVVSISEHTEPAHKFYATVKYMNAVNEYEFQFYPSAREGYCIHDGNAYRMVGSVVEKFLLSRFAENIYDNAEPPIMYNNAGDVIVPWRVDWNYKTVAGKYRKSTDYNFTEDILSYDMASALGVSFSIKPDICKINVYKGGELIFSGSDRDASALTFQKGEIVRVKVEAQWFYGSNEDFYGLVEYNFDVNITDRAEFYISGDSFPIGSLCSIVCANVKDVSKIEFTSEPSLPATPVFEMSSKNAVALLPILSSTKPGDYRITFKYGAAVQTFVITVNGLELGERLDSDIDAQRVRAAFTESVEQKMKELKQFAAENSRGEKLFYGSFLDYSNEEIGAVQYSSFGDVYVSSEREYMSKGHEYRFDNVGGVSIGVLNGGQVIKTGYNNYLGNYVIISHGCGLTTWYAHLSVIDVNVGDFVVREQTVGKTGTSGLSSVENVMIFAALESEFINPEYLCGMQID